MGVDINMNSERRGILKLSLKAARVNAGLTQEDVARATGFSRSALFRWKRGDTSPRADKLAQLCNLYRVDMTDIQMKK